MTSTHDATSLTESLVDWVRSVRPDANVRIVSGKAGSNGSPKPKSDKEIAVRLGRVEGLSGPRSGDAVSHKLSMEFEFDVEYSDPLAEHQAIADLAFAILERDDLGERREVVRGENSTLVATFVLHRQRELPRAKPVRETVFDLHPNARVTGSVRAENGFPIARARLEVRDINRMIVTDHNGGFAFSAPAGIPVRATVRAKGKTADVELTPGEPNLITLAMES